MTQTGTNQTVFPTLRYKDADAAIAFLTTAFGFTEVVAYRGDGGQVAHAQLAHGPSSVMLSQAGDSEFDRLFDSLAPTTVYVVVDEPDAHYARAVAAGAEVVMELTEQDYGSRDYMVRDPEGNMWCFGTYGGAA